MIFEQLFFPLTDVSTLFYCFHMFLYRNLLVYLVNNDDIRCSRYALLILPLRMIVSAYMTKSCTKNDHEKALYD